MNEGFIYISNLLLKSNHIHLNKELFEEEFVTHPDFPSIWALTDTLKSLGIVLKVIETNWEELENIFNTPFLAHIHTDYGHFVLVKRINSKCLTYIDDTSGKTITENKDVFVKKWNGRIAYIAENSNYKQCKNDTLNKIGIIVGLIILSAVLIYIGWYRNVSFYFGATFILKLIGFSISATLVLHKLGSENFLSRKACHLNQHIDCKAVLKSRASKIGNIHMSDIGIIYFSSGLCLLLGGLLWGNWVTVSNWLGIMSICSLPYIVFSISYQKWVLKKWCTLCIGIMCILLAENILFIGYGFHITALLFNQVIIILSIFIVCSICWYFLFAIIKRLKQIKKNHLMYLSLKKNHHLFRSLWKDEETCIYPDSYIYNPSDTRIPIDIALSLNCKHCADLFKQIILLADKNSDIYKFQLYITWSEDNIPQHTFMYRLISICQLQGERNYLLYLKKWYEEKNYDILHTGNVPELITENVLLQHLSDTKEWYRINHIMQTPTIYVGGKKIPDIYTLGDLRYFSDCFI